MELRQLRYFVAIVDSASISKAAARLYIAQSALSLQVSQLEEELGERLLHRSRSGVTPTERGEVFLRHARAILQQVRDAEHAVRAGRDEPSGEVTLAIPQSVSAALALPLIEDCLAQLPRVRLQLTEELSGHIAGRLQGGEIALAVMFDDDNLGDFEVVRLTRERLCAVGAPALLAASEGEMPLADLLSLPLILPTEGHGVRTQVDQLVKETGFQSLDVVSEITSIGILQSMLVAGIGVTVQARMPLAGAIERGELVARLLQEPGAVRRIVLCRSRAVPPSDAARAVWDLVVRTVERLCAQGRWPGAERWA